MPEFIHTIVGDFINLSRQEIGRGLREAEEPVLCILSVVGDFCDK